ncbi:TMV resistance protein N, partial [Mucuna pruriens]
MDDGELQFGDEIGPKLLKAIEESRISIVVFSENYAASSWCLDELVRIHECMKSKKQLVYPIFYKVDPSDVRYQNGSYGQAMTKHESRRDESKFIDDLVSKIFIKVSPKDLSRDEHIVGREYLVKELKSHLDLES